MKKIISTILLVLVAVLLVAGPAAAQKDKVNLKGEVVSFGPGTLKVLTNKGETFVVTVPDGFDLGLVQVGASVLVKGTSGADGSVEASLVKLLGKGKPDKGEDDQGQPEGFKGNSAYCADGKQEKPHPLAAKMAQRYGVSEEWVMDRFCEGYSMGAIMLAIKTSQVEGVEVGPDDLLAGRKAGRGWGLIWKELGLIGSEKNGHSPPGLLKKPGHAGPKDK